MFEQRKCEICGASFETAKRSAQRFCSQICQNKWQEGNTGFNNPKFQGGYVRCENCRKEFLVGKTTLENNKRHFCSAMCRQEWYANVWSKSDEWKEISRKRAVRILNSNVVQTQTKPQIAVNTMLEELFVDYRNEEAFVFYSIDNYLIDYDLAIEVMGDYWHSSPQKYHDKLSDRQRHIISRDKAKRTYLKEYHGIDILYLWEHDILNQPNLCKALIMLYITNGGCLDNYHSFNYSIDNRGELVLNKTIVYPYQERKIAC